MKEEQIMKNATYRVTIVDLENASITDKEFIDSLFDGSYKESVKKEFNTIEEAREYAEDLNSKGIPNYINTLI